MLPAFNDRGLLPPGDYELTLADLRTSMLVVGPGPAAPLWDTAWRLWLVDNLAVTVIRAASSSSGGRHDSERS